MNKFDPARIAGRQQQISSDGATPVRVLVADVEAPSPDLDALRGSYRAAWVLLRQHHHPHSLVEVDLHDNGESIGHFARVFAALKASAHGADDVVTVECHPTISVVIPTIVGRTQTFVECLDSLDGSDYECFDVVVVDNRREVPELDPLPNIVAGRRNLRVVRERRPGISAARNAGIVASKGEIIACTDDDVRVDPGWLTAIGRRFAQHPDEQIVTGLVMPSHLETPAQLMFERYYGGFSTERTFEPLSYSLEYPDSPPWKRATMVARDGRGQVVRRRPVYGAGACGAGCNIAFRRDALTEEEPFDVALGIGTRSQGGEDLAVMIGLLWRGGRIGYEPAALVHHQHRREYDELCRQMWGYGAGFTAMMTSLILHDSGHLVGLAAQLPRAATRLAKTAVGRLRGRRHQRADLVHDTARNVSYTFPHELAQRELLGYAHGPRAYLRSRRDARSWTPVRLEN
jgi:Glycosyl transferase family 2